MTAINPEAGGKTVLVADDNKGLLAALTKRLTAVGFKVLSCQDAYIATDLARQHKPDLILLDVNMPAGKGDSTHERLSKLPETSGIPVIYVTGDLSQRVRDRAQELGAFAVVRKPFDMPELLAHMFAALQKCAA